MKLNVFTDRLHGDIILSIKAIYVNGDNMLKNLEKVNAITIKEAQKHSPF